MFSHSGLLLVGLSLGLSNFAAAIGIGMGGVDANTRLKTGFIFGFLEALMPIVGLLIGQGLARLIGGRGHYVGAGILVLIGAFTLWQVRKTNRDTSKTQGENQQVNVGRLLLSGFTLSIDNLVVGFALSFYHVPFLLAAVMIAVVSVAMSLIGLELGNQLGKRFEQWSEVLSGVILILVGLAIGFGLF